MYYIYEWQKEKMKNWKKGKMRINILIFIYTIHFAYLKVYTKFENIGSNKSREICDRNFHWRERKNVQIKGLISNMWLFFVTQYNSSLSSFVPNFRIISQVVAEKSLTEKSLDRQTKKHNYRKDKNYKPPIYFIPRVWLIGSLTKYNVLVWKLSETKCQQNVFHIFW